MNEKQRILEESIVHLIFNYQFYGNLLALMNKRLDYDIPCAAVSVTDRVNLHINPTTFNQLPLEIRCAVLVHECEHILRDHVGRSKNLSKTWNTALNIAADRAINETIEYRSKNNKVTMVMPDAFKMNGEDFKPVTKRNFQEKYPGKTIKDNETMEYYYKFLKENAKPGDGGGFEGDFDAFGDHSKWEEGGSAESIRETIKNALNKAADRTSAGNIPGDIKQIIDSYNKSLVNWDDELRRFVAQQTALVEEITRKKRNRRHGLLQPGVKKDPVLNLGVIMDVSGSVNKAYVEQFFAEVDSMVDLGVDVTVVMCDTEVKKTFKYEKGQKFEYVGGGGTVMQPAVDWIEKEDNIDAIVLLTDGDLFDKLKVSLPIMYALCPPYSMPPGADKMDVIKIDIKKDQ